MDSDMIRSQGPRPPINPQQQQQPGGQQFRPTGPLPNNVNPNIGTPRPPPPNGQPPVAGQPNLVRPPPPPQLRRADSRSALLPPGQTPQQFQQQQRSNGTVQQQQPPPQQFSQQGQRPPGAPGQQPPRPINPNPGQPIRGPPPLLQQQQQQSQLQQNRPPFPINPQQNQQQQRPPLVRPQGPIGNNPQQQQSSGPPLQFRPPGPQQQQQPPQRPGGPAPPMRQPSSEFSTDPNQLRSQNSFERLQQQRSQPDPMTTTPDSTMKGFSRPSSVLSNDDDDDVVMGRTATPNNQQAIKRTPSDLARNSGPPVQPLQRNDSKLSIPSRPQSATDQHSKSPSPDGVNKMAAGYDHKTSENLPKIPEMTGQTQQQHYDTQRPPSVSFRDDLLNQERQRSAASPEPPSSKYGQMAGSKISLSSVVTGEPPADRISTPTSEKFRTSPLHQRNELRNHERPVSLQNSSIKSSLKFKGDNDSGVDETTQGNERNEPGSLSSPLKSPSKIPGLSRPASATPSNKSQDRARAASRTRTLKTPDTPTDPVKKLPMNKVQVGNAPSPNLKQVRSKIGSLDNATHKPGGGHVKIESKKMEFKVTPRIEAKNEKYQPKGGEKKITTTKLSWTAKSKIGSLENANHKPGGGDKKIESIKTEFKDKAKPKVGSKDNVKYVPGGGDIKIQTQKLDIKASSKIGSMDNMKHRPGGGDKKIFDDKDYLKNVDHPISPLPQTSQQQQYWGPPTLTSSMSLPAECIVLSVTSATSPRRKMRRISGSASTTPRGRAFHPRPFRLY